MGYIKAFYELVTTDYLYDSVVLLAVLSYVWARMVLNELIK